MKVLKLIICLCLAVSLNAQEGKKVIDVNKIQGVDAYFLSEPLQDYEVVLDSRNGLQWTSLLTGGLLNESVSAKANQLTKKVLKIAEEQNVKIDAVLYTGGKKIVGIVYKSSDNTKTKGLGKVNKINGVEVYVLGEPERDYQVVANAKGGVKMKSLLTAGIINNSIDEDIDKMIKKLNKKANKKGGMDAIIYQTGKSAIAVRFRS